MGFRLELSNAGTAYTFGFADDDNVVVTLSNLSTTEDVVALRLHIGDTSKNFDGINCVINAGVCGQVNGQAAAGAADGVTFLVNSDLDVFGGARDDEISVDFTSYSGGEGATQMSADDWVDGLKALFTGLSATQHVMTNPQLNVHGDTAEMRMYMKAEIP